MACQSWQAISNPNPWRIKITKQYIVRILFSEGKGGRYLGPFANEEAAQKIVTRLSHVATEFDKVYFAIIPLPEPDRVLINSTAEWIEKTCSGVFFKPGEFKPAAPSGPNMERFYQLTRLPPKPKVKAVPAKLQTKRR